MSRWRLYGGSLLVLFLLTAATVAAAEVDLGGLNTPIALGLAGMKAGLVAWVFMHLSGQEGLVRVVAAAGLLWLAILVTLTVADVATRVEPPGW